jgi:PAS domain S-box-containing protein
MGQLALQGEKPPIHEVRILSKSGEYVTGEFSITPFIQKERVVGILGVGRDITELRRAEEALQKAHDELEQRVEARTAELSRTNALLKREVAERKHVEEALRESEEKYRFVVDNANEAIFIAQDGVVKFPNPKTEDLTGYSAEELAKVPFVDLIHPEDRDMVIDMHQRRLAGEELPATYSFRIIDREGEELWVQLNTVLITWVGRPATLNFIREITQQKKLEAQLQQAVKMEAIGTLAGGIAHDFNNLLMAIQGNASLMLLDTDSGYPHYEKLKNIEQSVQSGAALTKQLLGIAKGGKYEVKPTYLNELIKRSLDMFGRTKKEITIHTKYQKDIWPVESDQSQIEQVLLNLYVNAWQAMPGEGEIYLQTENVTLDEDYVKPYDMEPGKYVKITVTDTGVGMDERTMERIFDPFFTTKEMGRGTGLGLASVYGIIKSHGGIINVYSEKGEGTTFIIYLPASEKEAKSEKELPENILKGTETILFIDDEDMIINVGQEILKTLGYKVLIARSGKEALEVYKENQDKIDMIILDMIMPDMGGGETYARMKEINPDITALLSSGYSINAQAAEILKKGCNGFIQKPFHIKELSQRIREILNRK